MSRRLLAAWLLGCLLAGASLAQPLILVVEGVNPYRLLGPLLGNGGAGLETGYLQRSPLVGALARQFDAEVRRLDWSGIPTDAPGLRRAVADLGAELLKARAERRPVYLVTHSLGSVIGVLALAEVANSIADMAVYPAADPAPILITLSSPLGRPHLLLGLLQFHPGLPLAALGAAVPSAEALNLLRWINIHTATDPLGGPLQAQGVENWALRVQAAPAIQGFADLVWAHTLPFREPAVVERLLGHLSEAAAPRP